MIRLTDKPGPFPEQNRFARMELSRGSIHNAVNGDILDFSAIRAQQPHDAASTGRIRQNVANDDIADSLFAPREVVVQNVRRMELPALIPAES